MVCAVGLKPDLPVAQAGDNKWLFSLLRAAGTLRPFA